MVEKVFQKRSKSPIFAVAKTICLLLCRNVSLCRPPYATSREMERRSRPHASVAEQSRRELYTARLIALVSLCVALIALAVAILS